VVDPPHPDGVLAAPPLLTRAQSDELGRRRRGRNIAMLIALLVVSGLFYALAIVKLTRPDLG
jgi:hypothetical protein